MYGYVLSFFFLKDTNAPKVYMWEITGKKKNQLILVALHIRVMEFENCSGWTFTSNVGADYTQSC